MDGGRGGRRRWRLRTRAIDLDEPKVMGVLNVTPDSFSDGGRFLDSSAAVEQGLRLAEEGADIVDVGGESTRPGAEPVDARTEIERVLPVVRALVQAGVVVSIDTMKPQVAEACLAAGAEIVNDVGGMADPGMRATCADWGCGVVVMHMKGTPRTMQVDPSYEDVVEEVRAFLDLRASGCVEAGIAGDRICVDPGIGFGKTVVHNLELLSGLARLRSLGHPLLVGTSRKSFLGKLTGVERAEDRDRATAVTVAMAVERGADVVRVHDAAGAREAIRVARAIVLGRAP